MSRHSQTRFIHREQLYKQVWSEPFTKLAPRYNLSPTELRKLCNKLWIPVPKVGHWSKIAFGKVVDIPPLPKYQCYSLNMPKKSK